MDGRDLDASIFLARLLFLAARPRLQSGFMNTDEHWKLRMLYPLLSRLRNKLVCFEQRPKVDGLTSPHVPLNGPIERQLEAATIQRSGKSVSQLNEL